MGSNDDTLAKFTVCIEDCKKIFANKSKDYGFSWQFMRITSLSDQILIKALRIRNIQDKGIQYTNDSLDLDFKGIVNYSIMALIKLKHYNLANDSLQSVIQNLIHEDVVEIEYNKIINESKNLLFEKNHDYNDAWRDMSDKSILDIIIMKLFRIKKIENNNGQTLMSEGLNAGFRDIMNYAIFCLIKSDGV